MLFRSSSIRPPSDRLNARNARDVIGRAVRLRRCPCPVHAPVCGAFERVILFLDFDGVLHPDPCPVRTRLFEHAPTLADALAPFDVELVLSTSWRSVEPLERLTARLPPALAERVIGATPHFSVIHETAGRLFPYPRHAECMAWLRGRSSVHESWLALDDRPDWFEPYCERLIICDSRTGLDAETLARLAAALERAGAC